MVTMDDEDLASDSEEIDPKILNGPTAPDTEGGKTAFTIFFS